MFTNYFRFDHLVTVSFTWYHVTRIIYYFFLHPIFYYIYATYIRYLYNTSSLVYYKCYEELRYVLSKHWQWSELPHKCWGATFWWGSGKQVESTGSRRGTWSEPEGERRHIINERGRRFIYTFPLFLFPQQTTCENYPLNDYCLGEPFPPIRSKELYCLVCVQGKYRVIPLDI